MLNEQSEILMKVKDLKKYYPIKGTGLSGRHGVTHAIDGISFDIYKGETLGIVGESGCGKSTIARQLVALERPTSGNIYYKEQEISKMSEHHLHKIRTQFQMVFQDSTSSLNPRKQIYDILAAPMLYHGIVKASNIDAEVERLLDIVGLPRTIKNRYPHEFSGGQRQRIGIAKALSLKPSLIICDEPVSALDVSVQAQILNLLKQLQKELQLTYLFIGHGLGSVHYISDRIAVMYLGKIVEIADAQELFENPAHPYSKILFDASPLPNPKLRNRNRIIVNGEIPSAAAPPSGCRFHPRCPYAIPSCSVEEPELKATAMGSSHLSACPVCSMDSTVCNLESTVGNLENRAEIIE